VTYGRTLDKLRKVTKTTTIIPADLRKRDEVNGEKESEEASKGVTAGAQQPTPSIATIPGATP